MEQFAHFVKNLKAAKDGDGTLLDHSIVVYGSSMSDPNRHMHEDVPCALLGRGDGALKPGRHVVYPENTSDQPVACACWSGWVCRQKSLAIAPGKWSSSLTSEHRSRSAPSSAWCCLQDRG